MRVDQADTILIRHLLCIPQHPSSSLKLFMHHSANSVEVEDGNLIQKRQRLGLILLAIFSLAYAGFIAVCTFAYDWTANTDIYGVPVSIAYGMSLNFLALIVAVVYGRLSRS